MTSSICADVLRELGFVPAVPEVSRSAGTAESKAGRHVPVVPGVPAQKSMERNGTERTATTVTPQPPQASTPPGRVLHLPANIAEQRQRLAEAMRAQGYDARLLDRVKDADIDGCQWLSPEGLKRYAEILAARFGASGARA